MMQPIIIILAIHILLAFFSGLLFFSGKSSLHREHMIPMISIPIVGPLMSLTIVLNTILKSDGRKPIELGSESFDDDILWETLVSYEEKGNIVPLEEAILINDVKVRRKYMLETLYDDPLKYLDVLMLAKNNEDVETSHYATTTISHAQKRFQVAIQDLAVAVESDRENLNLLDKYLEALEKYIGSNLLEEHLLRNMRIVYKEVLDRKLTRIKNDRIALIRKIRNSLELGEYASAVDASDLLIEYYPKDEQSWIEAVRVCVEGADNNRLREILIKVQKSSFNWSKQGREQIGPWVKEVAV